MVSEMSGETLIVEGTIGGRSPFDGQPLSPVQCTASSELPSLTERAQGAASSSGSEPIEERVRKLFSFLNNQRILTFQGFLQFLDSKL